MRPLWYAVVLLLGSTLPLTAQQAPVALSLEDALSVARQNNPDYQRQLTARERAGTALRSARGAVLPTATSSFGLGYRQGKSQYVQGVAFGSTSDILSSDWGVGISLSLSPQTVANVRAARAGLAAADADIEAGDYALRATVTQQYLAVLQRRAQAALQDTLVTLNQLQLELAQAKAGVGSATSLDVKRAEVALGRQRVVALRAHNDEAVATLTLYQQIGLPAPEAVTLTTTLPVNAPRFDRQQLLALAHTGNPVLRAAQARELAAGQNLQAARGAYLPTLSLGTSFGGATQKYTDAAYAAMIGASNQKFPFQFTSNPLNASLGLSLSLFDGFNREQRVQDAAAGRADARYAIRAQELKLTTDVAAAHATLVSDYQALQLQEQNAQAARDALQLAQERYRVGLNSLVDLQQARGDFAQAEADRIDATFEFHRAYAVLESTVGRPLR